MGTRYETFSYTPVDLAESMTSTVHDTVNHLYIKGYITETDYEYLVRTLAVYAMPNRKGFGKKLLERFFGKNENQDAYIFPIVEIDPVYGNNNPGKTKLKPKLNVVEGDFGKDKKDE